MIDALADCSIHSDDGQETKLPVSPLKVNNDKRTYLTFPNSVIISFRYRIILFLFFNIGHYNNRFQWKEAEIFGIHMPTMLEDSF